MHGVVCLGSLWRSPTPGLPLSYSAHPLGPHAARATSSPTARCASRRLHARVRGTAGSMCAAVSCARPALFVNRQPDAVGGGSVAKISTLP